MDKRKSASVLVVTFSLIAFSVLQVSPAMSLGTQGTSSSRQLVATGPTMFVEPDHLMVFENHTYIVNVRLNDVFDLAGWQFDLYWDRTMLSCINATVNTPPEWGGVGVDWFNKTEAEVNIDSIYTAWQFGQGVDNHYSATLGLYEKAECFGPHGGPFQNTFNGSMSLVTLAFKATRSGATALTLADTLLGNSMASPIEHTVLSGSGVLLVSGETEPPQTPSGPDVKKNNQAELETNGTTPSNWTIPSSFCATTVAPIYVNLTQPIEFLPANLTATLPVEVSPG